MTNVFRSITCVSVSRPGFWLVIRVLMFYRSDFVRFSIQMLPVKLCKQSASELTCSCISCQAFCLRDTSDCRNPANLEIVMPATEMAPLTMRLTADACRYCRPHQQSYLYRHSQCIEVEPRLCKSGCSRAA